MHIQNFITGRWRLPVVIAVLLCSIYMLTFSARIESTDTLFLFDASASLVRFGDTLLDLAAGVRPRHQTTLEPVAFYPLPDLNSEVLQVYLASPLYWLADRLPGVGLVHMVYLFNVLVTALAGAVFYLYTRTLGYSAATGVLGALLLGLGTIMWPYSKTFFQEPLALLLTLTAGLLLQRWRAAGYRSAVLLAGAALAGVGAVLAKNAAVLALPGLLLIALPNMTAEMGRARLLRRLLLIGLALLIVGAAVALLGDVLGFNRRLDALLLRLRQPGPYAGVALQSYLLSPGGSFWGTSPVLLLAVPGIYLLLRRWRVRYVLVAALMVAAYTLVYALVQGPNWFGGLSWPPRFLIPVVPFVFICALPVLERATQRPYTPGWIALVAVVALYALWVQLSGVSLWWGVYSAALPPESGGIGEWSGGLYDWRYLRWVVIPGLWPTEPLDFAWARTGMLVWPLLFLLLAGAALIALLRRARWWPLLPLLLAVFTFVGLRAIYEDDFFQASNERLTAMLPIIAATGAPGDVLLLSDLSYRDFFLNYGRIDAPRLVTLPSHPGERPSPDQPPEVTAENPDALVHQSTGPFINALAQNRDYLYLLENAGPFLPWRVRPVERYLTMHYYPITEISTGPDVRLLTYSTVTAPNPFDFRGPDHLTDLVYGEHIALAGVTLPAGTAYTPGDVLPVSLYWEALEVPEADYTVAWFVRAADGLAIAQGWDSPPMGGFVPTSAWYPGQRIVDNRALILPDDMAAGEYQLWVVLYHSGPEGIENLPVAGAATREGFIGVLPVRITVSDAP